MVPSVRRWIDQDRIASFLAVIYGFTWTIRGLLAFSGMGASWTLSILVGLACLSNHEVPDTGVLGLGDGDPRRAGAVADRGVPPGRRRR